MLRKTGARYYNNPNSGSAPSTAEVTAPTAAFTAPVRNGTVPFTVEFVDLSDGLPTSWEWDFGDGTGSREKNPVHTYTRMGTYTVILRVTNAGGGDTATRDRYITAVDVPVRAAFTATTLQGTAPLSVQFRDFSTGEVLTWDWEFGDGGHSTDKDPHYTYTRPGTYSVQLTVGSATGDTTSVRTNYIVVKPPVTTILTTIIPEPACIEEYTGEGRIRSGPDGTLTCTAGCESRRVRPRWSSRREPGHSIVWGHRYLSLQSHPWRHLRSPCCPWSTGSGFSALPTVVLLKELPSIRPSSSVLLSRKIPGMDMILQT